MVFDFSSLDLQEAPELPPKTLVAPLSVVRELRLELGRTAFNIQVGSGSEVRISSDLFAAFDAWSNQQQPQENESSTDEAWLN